MENKMKIYIGYDYQKNPISILISDSREKADIAWAGMNDMPHSVEEIELTNSIGIHGVAFILTSIKKQGSQINRDAEIRIFKRGL